MLAPRRIGERRVDVSHDLLHLRSHVARHVLVHEMLGERSRLGRDHDRQGLVLHLHKLGRVLCQVPGFGDHEGDRLARVADDLRGEAALRAAVREVGMRDEQR